MADPNLNITVDEPLSDASTDIEPEDLPELPSDEEGDKQDVPDDVPAGNPGISVQEDYHDLHNWRNTFVPGFPHEVKITHTPGLRDGV